MGLGRMEMKRYAACLITGFLLGMAIYFIFNHARRDSNKNGDYIRHYPNFRHGKTNGHDKAIKLTFSRNSLERR